MLSRILTRALSRETGRRHLGSMRPTMKRKVERPRLSARILRHTDYNFKTKEPILWTPPS